MVSTSSTDHTPRRGAFSGQGDECRFATTRSVQAHPRAVLVSGDKDLLGLSDQLRVYSPAEFVALIKASS